jgi:transposase
METFTLTRKEVHRPGLIRAVCGGRLTNAQAARALRLSVRQVRRLKRRFEAGGAAALLHRGRGRPSSRRLPASLRDEVRHLMTTRYAGFNDQHLTEKLREEHGVRISRESVRRLRRQLGVPPQRGRRAPQARRRRTPEAARGALVQIDGSPFAWFGPTAPPCVLLGAIDDATGEILALQFRPTEDLHGYATLFHHLFTTHGLPVALYGDRFGALVRNDRHWSLAEELAGAQFPTHLGRMLEELGVAYIAAHSPQAKGRVERLWATLQDRLVSELRLRGLTTVPAAHAYLPAFIADFNGRFGRPPAAPHAVWRRPPRTLALVLACRYRRVVARDNTVRLGPRWVQLRGGRSYAGRTVDVRELLDGRLVVFHEGVLRGQATSPGAEFVLKPRRAPYVDRRPTATAPAPPRLPRRLPRLSAPTHTGRKPLPTHPWIRAKQREIRAIEVRTGRTFSGCSEPGHFH